MKPEFGSRRLFGITRSKGKMYEFGLPEAFHIDVPPGSEPQELFILTVGTLGDVAATLSDAERVDAPLPQAMMDELGFSASFFDAFLESKFNKEITRDTALFAAAAYYLSRRPGSSQVLARQLEELDGPAVDRLLHWVLQAEWADYPGDVHPLFGAELENVAKLLAYHFYDGSGASELTAALEVLRRRAYDGASARDLLFIDIITAIIRMRLAASAWTTLPEFTGIASHRWESAIHKPEFPKELWPSQILLGQAGIFSGASGIIQMPTSAGKTRSVEIVLRSGFLSGRTKLAVVVAPFRALCHEIGTSLRRAFREDDVKVNELTDTLQTDFLQQVSEWLGPAAPSSQYILVLTPEKFLYVLRHAPTLVNNIGIIVYDEGHQFDSGSRGITYELLLTEIKALLPRSAQTVLISAVIQNAQAIGEWLIDDGAQVVGGIGLLPTARSVAFASWIERLGQLMFFESDRYDKYDYFVPRVIEGQALARRPRERVDQYFPVRDSSIDIALYLGIRLVSQGAVAIFCGRKDTAAGVASRAVDVFERKLALPPPASFSDPDEIRRMKNLVDSHFGNQSIASKAATLGIFVHHGTTPQGLRLSIEHAMQKGLINFVACTSTLAQGVNLPIRYLIVSGIHQAGERIKVRDFQNLVGRAGRSGMHTEGLIIFSDPNAYDNRRSEPWRFDLSVELLSQNRSESTTSSLLGLLAPFKNSYGKPVLQLPVEELCKLILSDEKGWFAWATEMSNLYPQHNLKAKALITELRYRRSLIFAVESYLMANRGTSSAKEFKSASEKIATATLAYHLASDEVKPAVTTLFGLVADYVYQQEPVAEKQAIYSKTLLGVRSAKAVEHWVTDNRELLLSLDSNEDWLATIWTLFTEQLDDKFFHSVMPEILSIQLALMWMHGHAYRELFEYSRVEEGTKSWGESRRRVTEDDIISFCENTLGYECSLILAAVAEFLFGENGINEGGAEALALFQKALKYGLPDWLSISCYERGFADRVIAQHLCDAAKAGGFSGKYFVKGLVPHRKRIEAVLKDYPSYFETVLAGLL